MGPAQRRSLGRCGPPRAGLAGSWDPVQACCAVDKARPLQPCRRRAASDREQIDRAGRCLPYHWNRARWPPLKRLLHRCAVRRRVLPTHRGGRCKPAHPDPISTRPLVHAIVPSDPVLAPPIRPLLHAPLPCAVCRAQIGLHLALRRRPRAWGGQFLDLSRACCRRGLSKSTPARVQPRPQPPRRAPRCEQGTPAGRSYAPPRRG